MAFPMGVKKSILYSLGNFLLWPPICGNFLAISPKCYNSKDTNFIKRHNTLKSTFAKNRFASVIKHDTSAAKKFYFKLKLVTKMSYQQLVIYIFFLNPKNMPHRITYQRCLKIVILVRPQNKTVCIRSNVSYSFVSEK